ncbi:hypothetical protein AC249_AIPGENE5241 [Exaiptasia diaphana]|nr:hypothetical protein AC249_AIPGENE5241 [Exaiptasia diaphana]
MASDDNNSPPPVERDEIPPEDGEITPPTSRGRSKRSHKSRHHETSSSSSDESSSDESSGHESDPKSDGSEKEEPSTKETEDDYQRFDTQSKAPKKFKLPANMKKYISNTFTTFVGDKFSWHGEEMASQRKEFLALKMVGSLLKIGKKMLSDRSQTLEEVYCWSKNTV